MKSTSHFAMGHLLYAALQKRGIYLNRIAFVYGNIAPDYAPTMLVPTHFGKACTRAVDDISSNLSELHLNNSGRVSAEYSKQLGIMCHYICDYFCFAHNKDFTGSLKQHVAYENRLDSYLRRCCVKLYENNGNDSVSFFDLDGKTAIPLSESSKALSEDIDQLKSDYLSIGNTFRNDLSFAFDACMRCITSIVAMSKKAAPRHSDLWLDELLAPLKGYATGNSLVFRMFFFKNRNNNIFFLPELMPPIGAY